MSLQTFFQQLTSREQARAKTAGERYTQLIRDVGDGKKPTTETVEAVLRENGRTVSDLEAAVARHEKRQAAAVKVGSGKAAAERARTLQTTIARAVDEENAAILAAAKKREGIVADLHPKARAAEAEVRAGEAAEKFLREDAAPQEELEREIADVSAMIVEAKKRRAVPADLAGRAHKTAVDALDRINVVQDGAPLFSGLEKEARQRRAAEAAAEEASFLKEVETIAEEIKALERRLASLESKHSAGQLTP